ncbi:putative threonine efflux protein [Paramagnetospirillum caucaseum]|uniref:Putative threonine efflux protein n=1 Tax=Paramagnetospirillum caucaseum TaxID=1244869 RepID=M2YEP7_9PROT|nr:LysE family translocator [Paramagnetospirillum caucaseum]EME71456.1 putative threonine efflux protein [Paramagnetospirillum caucaseum]
MIDSVQALGFLAAAMLITLSPGPDNLMILGLGLSRGRRSGMAFGLGCALGCLSHTVLAALGISAAIAASPVLFTGLKLAGGAYLVWLGIGALRSSGAMRIDAGVGGDEPLTVLFRRGLLANAINPKVILFFLAFLPQFVDTAKGGAGWQTAQLGLLFTLQACVLFGIIGWFAGSLGGWLGRHGKAGLWLDRLAGGVFVALGLKLIIER